MKLSERKLAVQKSLIEIYEIGTDDAKETVKKFWSEATAHIREEFGAEYREAVEDGVSEDFWEEQLDEIAEFLVSYTKESQEAEKKKREEAEAVWNALSDEEKAKVKAERRAKSRAIWGGK